MTKSKTAAKGDDRVPISSRALIQRVNRKLRDEGQMLKKSRGAQTDVGDYYVLDTARNALVWKRVDLIAFAKKLGLIQPWEELNDA